MQIVQMQQVKLLQGNLVSTLFACAHIDSFIVTTDKRVYLLNELGRPGLSITGLTTAVLSLVVVRFQYALPAIG